MVGRQRAGVSQCLSGHLPAHLGALQYGCASQRGRGSGRRVYPPTHTCILGHTTRIGILCYQLQPTAVSPKPGIQGLHDQASTDHASHTSSRYPRGRWGLTRGGGVPSLSISLSVHLGRHQFTLGAPLYRHFSQSLTGWAGLSQASHSCTISLLSQIHTGQHLDSA